MPAIRNSRLQICWTAIGLVPLISNVCANGQPSFQGLGFINPSPGAKNVSPGSAAGGLSPDGTVVFGTSVGFQVYYGRESVEAFRWAADTGMVPLGFLIPGNGSYPNSVAHGENAFHIVGMSRIWGSNNSPVIWNGPNNITPLPWPDGYPQDVGGNSLSMWSFARNSPAIAGAFSTNNKPGYYWANPGATPMQILPPDGVPANTACIPVGMSSDGTAIIGRLSGSAYSGIFSWSTTGGSRLINIPLAYSQVTVLQSHPDIPVVIGTVNANLGNGLRAYAFRIVNGEFGIIPSVPGPAGFVTTEGASKCTPDGSVILGSAAFPGLGVRPALWTAATGWLGFESYMTTTLGLDLTGWTFGGSWWAGISDDGTVIVGTATHNGLQEAFRAVIPPFNVDTDGDGLFDEWEINGIPYVDSLGQSQRYMLPGADPLKKNLWVEVDVMKRPDGTLVPFSLTSLEAVKTAFANASVSNPDGSTGITLHIQVDDLQLPHEEWVELDSLWDFYRPFWFGTESERNAVDAAAILDAKARAFRHCTFMNRVYYYNSQGQLRNLLGVANGIHSASFSVSLGGVMRDPEEIEWLLRSTFIHEFGHTLGLRHGGADDINYKPNYVSAMNYNFDLLRDLNGDRPALDFAREALMPLNEANLDESSGVPTQQYQNFFVPHAYRIPGQQPEVRHVLLGSGAHDWNNDGEIQSGVITDLNWFPADHPFASSPSSGEIMDSHDDWAALIYAVPPVRESAGVGGGCAGDECVCELTEELIVWHEANIPRPPIISTCVADITGDRMVGVPDLLAVIDNWGSCPQPCPPACNADVNGDCTVNVGDLLVVLSGWGMCP